MTITLSLPLSATALREGSEFLARLSALAEVIRAEASPQLLNTLELSHPALGTTVFNSVTGEQVSHTPAQESGPYLDDERPLFTSGGEDRPADFPDADDEPEQAPELQYETVVTGLERDPDYAGDYAAFGYEAMVEAGWTDQQLLEVAYLREVTEQRPLAVAPGASASAAPAPPAPGAGASQSGTVDKDGIVWDERIHSDAAEKLSKEGFWKRRRNISDELWNSVRAELGATAPGASAPATTPAPGPKATQSPTPPAPGGNHFGDFTKWMMVHIKAQAINQTDVTLAVQQAGLTTVPDLGKHPELIEVVKQHLIETKGLQA